MVKKFRFSLLLLAVMGNLAWSMSAKAGLNGNLSVEIDGLKNKQGQLCLSVFSSTQGFPSNRDRALLRQCTKITDTTLTFTFKDLKAGSYAVAAYHDANGDRTLNRNNLGMPVEGFGFSRNPEVTTSAPKFGDAAFLLAGTNTNIQIKLKYL
ncbi:MAG: DUF2141 domain-containing protein [Heteroscytonema crispum UTEX LB 1556]